MLVFEVVDKVILELHPIPVVDRTAVVGLMLGAKVHLEEMIALGVLEKDGLLRFYVLAWGIDQRLHLTGVDVDQIYGLVPSTQNERERLFEERERSDEILLYVCFFLILDLPTIEPVLNDQDDCRIHRDKNSILLEFFDPVDALLYQSRLLLKLLRSDLKARLTLCLIVLQMDRSDYNIAIRVIERHEAAECICIFDFWINIGGDYEGSVVLVVDTGLDSFQEFI